MTQEPSCIVPYSAGTVVISHAFAKAFNVRDRKSVV